MKLYEIVNPSDPVTFHAPDDATAVGVAVCLGEGAYMASRCSDGENVGGFALFASKEQTDDLTRAWFGGLTLGEWLDVPANRSALRVALLDCATMGAGERATYDDACAALAELPDKLAAYKAGVQDRNRGSMNNIVGRAWKMAERLAAREKETTR